MKINSKVFYDENGKVLKITGEFEGEVIDLDIEKEVSILKEHNKTNVYYIELEHGTLVEVFTNAKSYYVDTKNKKLVVDYYTQEELEDIKNQQEEQLKKEQEMNDRINAIAEYLQNSDLSTISLIEDSITQIEQYKEIVGEEYV